MREWFRKYGKWATGADAAISLGEKLVYALTTSAVSGALLTGFGWFLENWVAGVLLGLGAFALLQVILTVRAIRQPEAGLVGASLPQPSQPHHEASRQLSRPTPSASYPWATDEELKGSYIHNRSLHIFDLARKNVTIRGKTLEDCQVYGPAVITPFYGEWPFDDACTWEEGSDPLSLTWASSPDLDRKYVGAIGLENCFFRNCSFVRVGLLLNPERYEQMTGLPAPSVNLGEPSAEMPTDEELKSDCLQLSSESYQFVKDHGGLEIGDYLDPDTRRRNDDTMLEYEQSLGGRVNGLFRKLQRRGWWQPEAMDPKKRKRIESPGFLSDVQDIAKELSAIGHEH